MTYTQLYLVIGVPVAFNAVMFALLALFLKSRFDKLDQRFDEMFSRWDSELYQ